MNALARRVAGDWFVLREASRSPEEIVEVLGSPDLPQIAEGLRNTFEEGTVEYKRGVSQPALLVLEESRFRSLEHGDLDSIERAFASMVYVTLVQRLICVGIIEVRDLRSDQIPIEDQATGDVKEIIGEIQARVRAEKGFRERPEVKNILLQVSKYRNEMDTLRKLTHNAPKETAAQIVRNSQATFGEIFASIRRNYQSIVKEDVARSPREVRNPLLKHELKPLAKLFMDQAQLFQEFRSTVAFVRTEQFRPRETLVDLADRHDEVRQTVENEKTRLVALGGSESAGRTLARQFATETLRVTRRLLPE